VHSTAGWLRSLLATRRGALFGVGSARSAQRLDNRTTFDGVAAFVVAAALLTSFLAARRAAGIEPLELMRSE